MAQVILTASRRVGRWTRPRSWSSVKWGVWSLVTRRFVYSFVHRKQWGVCLFSLVHDGQLYRQWPECDGYEGLGMIAKKKVVEMAEVADHVAPLETKLLVKHLGLVHHCAATRYSDGDARATGNVTIGTQGQSWVVTVNDRDTGKRLKVIAATVDAALAHAAALVSEPEAPWEDAPWLKEEAPRRRKK